MIPFDALPDAVIIVDADGLITRVNAELNELFGYSSIELVGQPIEILLPAEMRQRHIPLREAFQKAPATRPMAARSRLQGRRKDGSEFPVEIMLSPLDQVQVLGVIRDTTAAREMSDRLQQLAYDDALTGLSNRTALNRDLKRLLYRPSDNGPASMAVALLDLDSFKEINDTMGHSSGDELLKCVVERWRNVLGAGPSLYRLGGDEFLLLVTSGDPREIVRLSKVMQQALETPFEIAETVIFVSVSVGIAVAPSDGSDGETLIGNADMLATSPIALPVGRWILRTACEYAASWRRAGLLPSRVSVNLFPVQFHDPSFVDDVREVLAETALEPNCLELELTENIVLTSNTTTRASVARLRELGVQFALDDFGTGYASLSLLTELPLTRIKIDRTFIRGLPEESKSIVLVRSLITMAHGFGMTVIAEGVETAAQATFLRNERCDEAQGFLFARPQSAAMFETTLGARADAVPGQRT